MTSTSTLYRVIVRTTGSVQGGTYWKKECLYCGYDRLEAARLYHESRAGDYRHGYGNPARETVGQSKSVSAE